MQHLKTAGFVVAGVAIGWLLAASGVSFGGVYNNVTNYFSQGIFVGTSSQFTVEADGDVSTSGDAIVSGGSLTVTTAAGATSTLTVGKIVSYATSSATAINICLVASSTQMATGYNGLAYWTYQTCP